MNQYFKHSRSILPIFFTILLHNLVAQTYPKAEYNPDSQKQPGNTSLLTKAKTMIYKYKLFISILMLLLFTTGCISNKRLEKISKTTPIVFNKDSFNGNYLNSSIAGNSSLTLWNVLYDCKSFINDTSHITNNSVVSLRFDGNNKLVATASENNVIINKITLQAEQYGNYLSIKRNFYLVPIPFIYYHYQEARVLLSKLDNGNINIKFGKNEFLWIFMAGGQDYKFSLEYTKSN